MDYQIVKVLLSWLVVCTNVNIAASLSFESQKILDFPQQGSTSWYSSGFGVGFDLTGSYGMAAISYANGTTVTTAPVPAQDDYTEMLYRLSLPSSRHLTPPYENIGDSWIDMPRQLRRKARKAFGFPASEDVGHLANMFLNLRAQVEMHLGHPITGATITAPNLVALYTEDLQDAFEYLNLQYLSYYVGNNVLHETNAAYAGYGYGLCADYENREACRREQNAMPAEAVMAVLYTRSLLTVSLSFVKSAYYLYEPVGRYVVDFGLGYDARTSLEGGYWNTVRYRLGEVLRENPYYERPSKVLLMGDCVGIDRFRDALYSVLDEETVEMPLVLVNNSQGVAAAGAAEFAKRIAHS